MGRLQDLVIVTSFAIGVAIVMPVVFLGIIKNK